MKRILFALAITLALPIHLTAQDAATTGPVWMMVVHEVEDCAAWRAIFDSGISTRQSAGELRFEIAKHPAYPNDIIAIFQWDTAERARAFVDDPAVRNAMKAAGVISEPIVTFYKDTPRFDGG